MEEDQTKVNDTAGAPNVNLLNTLLSNPDLIRRVGAMLSAAQSTGAVTETDTKASAADSPHTQPPQATPTGAGVTQDGLSALLSDPAMLEKLPQIIAAMKPLMGAMPPPPKEEKKTSPELCRDNLLCALKPFLSPSRCEAVDTIIRISKLGTVFKQLT